MTSMLPALMGALVGAGLYVAFDFYCLSARRRHVAATRAQGHGSSRGVPRQPDPF